MAAVSLLSHGTNGFNKLGSTTLNASGIEFREGRAIIGIDEQVSDIIDR